MARIILVDDHVDSREVVRQLLEAKGHSTQCFEMAEDALRAIEAQVPQVVITDQRLPGMSGMELVSRVRSRWPTLRTILSSADDSRREDAQRAGAGFWLKGSDEIFTGIDELSESLNLPATT